MADSINDGGPAFPVTYEHSDATCEHHGVSIRDYFAGIALAPCMYICRSDTLEDTDANRAELFARKAYEMADAMLKARQS